MNPKEGQPQHSRRDFLRSFLHHSPLTGEDSFSKEAATSLLQKEIPARTFLKGAVVLAGTAVLNQALGGSLLARAAGYVEDVFRPKESPTSVEQKERFITSYSTRDLKVVNGELRALVIPEGSTEEYWAELTITPSGESVFKNKGKPLTIFPLSVEEDNCRRAVEAAGWNPDNLRRRSDGTWGVYNTNADGPGYYFVHYDPKTGKSTSKLHHGDISQPSCFPEGSSPSCYEGALYSEPFFYTRRNPQGREEDIVMTISKEYGVLYANIHDEKAEPLTVVNVQPARYQDENASFTCVDCEPDQEIATLGVETVTNNIYTSMVELAPLNLADLTDENKRIKVTTEGSPVGEATRDIYHNQKFFTQDGETYLYKVFKNSIYRIRIANGNSVGIWGKIKFDSFRYTVNIPIIRQGASVSH